MKFYTIFYQFIFWMTLTVFGSMTSNAQQWYINDSNKAGDIFTSAIGSKNNSGLSVELPSNSITTIFSKVKKGDTVFIDTGSYPELAPDGTLLIPIPQGVSVVLFSEKRFSKNNIPNGIKATAEEFYILNDKPVSREIYLKSRQ